ncbi:MAG TPA: hypothetical protein VNQ90_02605 [Chthoniobacteraceae bacterium]|nr:hypothetical protein [Chthoniobacteraceae bacterium]
MRRLLIPVFLLTLLALFGEQAQAQVQVGLEIKRRLFVAYEPVVATVTIRNMSGRDLPLADEGSTPWFGFQVVRDDGRPVGPFANSYQLEPLIIPAGQTVRRSVTLNTLYPINDYGLYRIRATIYFSPHKKYFQSVVRNIEISEGKVFWRQTVGVPDGMQGSGETRIISALKFRKLDANYLYIRIEDPDNGLVYCTFPTDRLISGMEPQLMLDLSNQLHVLQVSGPKTYLHTQVDLNGKMLSRETYLAVKSRPALKRDIAGNITVRGGRREADQVAQNEIGSTSAELRGIPKLSDRPANLPKE